MHFCILQPLITKAFVHKRLGNFAFVHKRAPPNGNFAFVYKRAFVHKRAAPPPQPETMDQKLTSLEIEGEKWSKMTPPNLRKQANRVRGVTRSPNLPSLGNDPKSDSKNI